MMLVEQNARIALDLADVGYVMEIGRIVMDGSADRLMESEDIKSFYLGHQEEGQRCEVRVHRQHLGRQRAPLREKGKSQKDPGHG